MYKHISVLLNESIEALKIKEDGIYVDCTLGGAGHSSEILKRLKTGHLYCFDQDDYAINVSKEKLQKISNNFTIIKANFVEIKEKLFELGVTKVDGILYDLGVSSFQFDIDDRGFSYNNDARLDMRMNQNQSLSAYEVVNDYSLQELITIFSKYGEITYPVRLAEAIVQYRKTKKIDSTLEFVEVIKDATPQAVRKKGHPAKKVFQAVRIAVNDELRVIEKSLNDALTLLNDEGIIVVISFHSLEDRIVKNIFKNSSTFHDPLGLPLTKDQMKADFELTHKKVILPSKEELENNNRAHSAKMRVIKKVKK